MLDQEMSVQDFVKWWMVEKPFNPPKYPMTFMSKIWGATLFREGQFQVQFFMGSPFAAAPAHRHPNIEVVDMIVGGRAMFDSDLKDHDPKKMLINIHADEMHSSYTGRHGACFLCFQKWLNGIEPTSVELDWTGEQPIDEVHAVHLEET